MAVIKGGGSAALLDVGANTKGSRVEIRPVDVGSLGSYQVMATSGTMAAGLAAGAPIFSARWGDATRTCIIRSIRLQMNSLATGFTAGLGLFDMIIARSFTIADTGGTAVTLTGNNAKKKTAFGTSLWTDMRIASTATLTAGTRTLDNQAVCAIRAQISATANQIFVPTAGELPTPLWLPEHASEWPLTLVQNEGIVIRATVPATGTWEFRVCLEWSEVLSTAGYN